MLPTTPDLPHEGRADVDEPCVRRFERPGDAGGWLP